MTRTGTGWLLVCLLLIISIRCNAQSFVMTDNCLLAYQHFMAMRINKGKAMLLKESKANPGNYLPHVLINYEDFISLVFNENPQLYKQKKSLKESRLSVIERGDHQSPYYLFSKALLYFQWSMIQIKYADYWQAAWDFRHSYLLFQENKKRFPEFRYHDIFIGAQQAVISTIPAGYRWITGILGLKGNMKTGMDMLSSGLQNPNAPFAEEAHLYSIYLENYIENDTEGAAKQIETFHLDIVNNQLFCFMAANLSLNNKKAALTEKILRERKTGDDYLPFPMLEYELAEAMQRRLSPEAVNHYLAFLSVSKSNFYLKDACQSIALNYYLQGNLAQAEAYRQKIKTIGKTDSDADKEAQKFATQGRFPDRDLLKARLLNDGGYHDQSLQLLVAMKNKRFASADEQLEYIYRLARVYDDLEQDDKALYYYGRTIAEGKNSTKYFAARAALQAGYLFEKKGQKTKALNYFQQVLDMDDHDYKNSLDQRAKSGINRLSGS